MSWLYCSGYGCIAEDMSILLTAAKPRDIGMVRSHVSVELHKHIPLLHHYSIQRHYGFTEISSGNIKIPYLTKAILNSCSAQTALHHSYNDILPQYGIEFA